MQSHVHDYVADRSRGAPLVSWPFNAYIQNMADTGSGIAAMVTDNTSDTITENRNVASSGGGNGENMPPFITTQYMIKT